MSAILMYHYLGQPPAGHPHRALWVPAEEFREQLEVLRASGRRTVLGPEYSAGLRQGTLDRAVWLTFDDGAMDNYTVALPLLKSAGLRATFFVTVERCLAGESGYIPLPALREMVQEGMEVASHSLTHPRLARLGAEELRREVTESRARLEDALGTAVVSFCYPYGNQSATVREAVQAAGYALATGTMRDNCNREADRWALRRAMVQPGRTGRRFRHLFGRLYHWGHALKNARRWKE